MTAREKITMKLLRKCLNPLSGPVDPTHFLATMRTLSEESLGDEIDLNLRLEWFVYEMTQNSTF
jgi:hypothetical protein